MLLLQYLLLAKAQWWCLRCRGVRAAAELLLLPQPRTHVLAGRHVGQRGCRLLQLRLLLV